MKKSLLAAFMLLFAMDTQAAGTLVHCLAGCPSVESPLTGKLKAEPASLPATDTFWIGPSLGLTLFARDNATKTWESGVALAFNYGVFWRPVWSPTASFLSFNMGLSAGSISAFSGGSSFDVTVPFTVGIMDIIAIGYGPRIRFATNPDMKDSVSGVLFIGLATSFGGP